MYETSKMAQECRLAIILHDDEEYQILEGQQKNHFAKRKFLHL